jgi:hypothetical protein
MGPALSTAEIRERRWARDVSALFGCAKMADRLPFVPQFIHPLLSPAGALIYALVDPAGAVLALSHETLALSEGHRTRLPAANFVGSAQLSPAALLLLSADGLAFLISDDGPQFSVRNFSVESPLFALPGRTADSFVIISSSAGAYLCQMDGSVAPIWPPRGPRPLAAAVLTGDRVLLVVSLSDSLLVSLLDPISEPVHLSATGGFRKIVPTEANRFIGISADKKQIISIGFNADLGNPERLSLAQGSGFCELALLGDQTAVGCGETVIFTVAAGNQVESCDLSKTQFGREIDTCKGILAFPGQDAFVLVFGGGQLVVCRASDFQKKEPYRQKRLHAAEIVAFCSGEEFSFLTCDAAGNCILWENVPDWWDAPYAFRLFEEAV